jgi:hypothetical protein
VTIPSRNASGCAQEKKVKNTLTYVNNRDNPCRHSLHAMQSTFTGTTNLMSARLGLRLWFPCSAKPGAVVINPASYSGKPAGDLEHNIYPVSGPAFSARQ